MATAEQIKSLIRTHFTDDSERVFTLALQVAVHEAEQGPARDLLLSARALGDVAP